KALRPERFDTDPDSSDARKQWNHWYFTFQNYLTSLKTPDDEKFQVLANLVSSDVFEYIADCKQYKDVIDALISLCVKPKNIIYARHLLSTCTQQVGQNLEQFMQKLKQLVKDCGFKTVNASEYHDETIRDAFIRGMLSNNVRQRLLEEDDIDLAKAFTQARALETAESQSLSYTHPRVPYNGSCALHSPVSIDPSDSGKPDSNLAATIPKCFFCGYKHPRSKCPSREALCRNCNKVGHFQRVYRVKQTFEYLKRELENAAVITINYQIPLVVETDAPDTAIAATLNQDDRPVALFSRTLNPSERNHSPVEKEAYAIVEALRKWRHYLLGVHFKLLTVEEVELLDCNPQYAHVRLPNRKEEAVTVKHLAPRGEPDDLGTSECLADANDLIEATEIAHEMCSNDEAADFPTPTNYELSKQKQQRLHPYNLRSREARS
ncbi:uncharacterized protein DEA37_0001456, partial [Paragonimus westermani]